MNLTNPFSNINSSVKIINKKGEWYNNWLLAAFVLTLIFLFFTQLIWTGKAIAIWDADGQYMPYQMLVADHIRQGSILTWDPWSNAGISLIGDPQVGAVSPINLIFALLFGGTVFGYNVLWLFVWWLGGIGVLILGRHFKISAWVASIIALQFLYSGIYISNAAQSTCMVGYSFIPFVFWRWLVAIETKRMMPAIQAAAIWGLSALSAYPSFTIITALFIGFYTLGFVALYSNSTEFLQTTKFAIRALLLFVFIGAAIASPVYFSLLHDGVGTTTRSGVVSLENVCTINPLPVGALASISSPYWGAIKKVYPDIWRQTDITMVSVYMGLLPFFALFGLLTQMRSKKIWLILGIALLMLLFAMSDSFPFRTWLYQICYPTRFFKHSALFRAYFIFAITLLAILGVKKLEDEFRNNAKLSTTWNQIIVAAFLSSLVSFLLFYWMHFRLPNVITGYTYALLNWAILWLGLIVAALICSLVPKSIRVNVFLSALFLLVVIDFNHTLKVSRPIMMQTEKQHIDRWKKLDQEHQPSLSLLKNAFLRAETHFENSPWDALNYNDQMITKKPVLVSYATQKNVFYNRMLGNDIIKNTALGSNRIWFATTAIEMLPTENNYSLFEKKVQELGAVPLVVHTKSSMLGSPYSINNNSNFSKAQAMKRIDAKLLRYEPNLLELKVNAPHDGWLLVTDRWARTWQVMVNNKPTELWAGNFVFRAFKISGGNNTVLFRNKPSGFPYLLVLSWGTMLFVLLASLTLRFTKKGNPILKDFLRKI